MNWLFLIFIVVFPFSGLLFNKMDIWHAHGHWFALGIGAIFAYSFFVKPKEIKITNKPLALLVGWVTLQTLYFWYRGIVELGRYDFLMFATYFNFLCFLIFYKLSLQYLNQDNIRKIINFLRYSVLIVVAYSFLQLFYLDQFYVGLGGGDAVNYRLVGVMGNPTHLACYLAICLPLFYLKDGWIKWTGLIGSLVIILITGSLLGIIVAGSVVSLFALLERKKANLLIMASSVICLLIFIFIKRPEWVTFFSWEGRWNFWKYLLLVFKKFAITGTGLNLIAKMSAADPFKGWRHAHCEYYHFAIETGLIGLGLIIYCIVDYVKRFMKLRFNGNVIILGVIFAAFLIACLANFPAHLFLLAIMCMISYTFLYVIENELKEKMK